MKADYIVRQGEDISLSLLALEGDISDITEASAVLKRAGPKGSVPSINAPILETFTTSSLPLPDIGWSFLIEGEKTALLSPGFYITNASLKTNTALIKTDPVLIEIKGTVT